MPQSPQRNSHLPGPLPAVLMAAGFFIFLVVGGRTLSLGPASWGPAVASGGAQGPPAGAQRVSGVPRTLSDAAGVDDFIADLAWLRAQGTGLIVVEAWLDARPQAELRAYDQSVRARFEALPNGTIRRIGLQVLSETSAALDAPQRMVVALKASRPLLMAYGASLGGGAALPDALKGEAYGVSLRGDSKKLPSYLPVRLPFADLLQDLPNMGGVPPVVGAQAVAAVLGIQGQWLDSLGLEAYRLAKGLPLEALHYRWTNGGLSSVELEHMRYPLDAEGRFQLSFAEIPELPSVSLEALRGDPSASQGLRGKTVFYRPWPMDLADSQAFDAQFNLFSSLMAGEPKGQAWPSWQTRIMALGGVLASLLAWVAAPLWVALSVWLFLVGGIWVTFSQEFMTKAQIGALGLALLLFGLGWRLQKSRLLARDAQRLLGGVLAEGHHLAWRRRLGAKVSVLSVSYAVLGPRTVAGEPWWESWMERWGAFMDESVPGDCLGFALPNPGSEEAMAGALLALRRQDSSVCGGLARGDLSFKCRRRLGATVWEIQGSVKDRALDLFLKAQRGQILLLNSDFPAFDGFFEGRLLPVQFGGQAQTESVVNVLGPKTGLWRARP